MNGTRRIDPAARPLEESADAAYQRRRASAYARLDAIRKAVDLHAVDQADCGRSNWGYVGDMAEVDEKLREVQAFIGPSDEAAAAVGSREVPA